MKINAYDVRYATECGGLIADAVAYASSLEVERSKCKDAEAIKSLDNEYAKIIGLLCNSIDISNMSKFRSELKPYMERKLGVLHHVVIEALTEAMDNESDQFRQYILQMAIAIVSDCDIDDVRK